MDDKVLAESKCISVETLLHWKKRAEINAAQEAAHIHRDKDNMGVYDELISIKKELKGFIGKWSVQPKPKFSRKNVVRFLQQTFIQNSEKRSEYDGIVVKKINKIKSLATVFLEEGHPLITDLEEAIKHSYDYDESSMKRLVKALEKLVTFITTQ